jgi:hypothetical protein
MITNNKKCCVRSFDMWRYCSIHLSKGCALLGPQFDALKALWGMEGSFPDFVVPLPAKQQYAFNAILSKSTNAAREHLARVIEEGWGGKGHGWPNWKPIFTPIGGKWQPDHNNQGWMVTTHLTLWSYMEVVLDSAFTLFPKGHNLQCFCMHMAIKAGSIQVVLRDNLHYTKSIHSTRCVHVLLHWHEALVRVFDSWENCFPPLRGRWVTKRGVEMMQVELLMEQSIHKEGGEDI